MKSPAASLESMVASMNEKLSSLLRLQLGPLLHAELADERARKIYAMTGEATAGEIARTVGASKNTIITCWEKWETLGIITRHGKAFTKTSDIVGHAA
jgi:hypothetical protein